MRIMGEITAPAGVGKTWTPPAAEAKYSAAVESILASAPAKPVREKPLAIIVPHGTNDFIRMSEAEYFADPCEKPSLSQSIAGVIDRQSPAHGAARHPRLGGYKGETTESHEKGTLIHALLLGDERVVVVEAGDWRTKAARERRQEIQADGGIAVLEEDHAEAEIVAETLRTNFEEKGISLKGESELPIFWTEQAANGEIVQCRGLLDKVDLETGEIRDLKSCASAHPEAISRHIDAYRYDVQHTAYTRAVGKVLPRLQGRVRMTFVFFELVPPYVVVPVVLDGMYREMGERRWKRAVDAFGEGQRNTRWPGYVDGVLTVSPPQWALAKEIERQVDEEGQG